MSMQEMRKKIDEVDDKIVRLIAERIRQSQSIGREKQKSSKPVEDVNREKKVLAHITAVAREEKLDEGKSRISTSKSLSLPAAFRELRLPSRARLEPTARRRFFNISVILSASSPAKVLMMFLNW